MSQIGSDQQDGEWIPDQLTYKDIEYWEWIVRLGINPEDVFVPFGQRPCWGLPCYLADLVDGFKPFTHPCKQCPHRKHCRDKFKDKGQVKD